MGLLQEFQPGEVICRENELGDDMYIIKSGTVEIFKTLGNDEMVLAELNEKEFFGEMALFGVKRRTASVRAKTGTELITVTKQMLGTQYKKAPDWLVSMIKTIASRIITTSKGVKAEHKVSLPFSLLKLIILVGDSMGTPTYKGFSIPISVLRDELMYTLGLGYNEIDIWLKRFTLVNLVKSMGTNGLVEVPDTARLEQFTKYLYSKSPLSRGKVIDLDSNTLKSYDRIYKLLNR